MYAGEGLAFVTGKTFGRSGVVSAVEELNVLAAWFVQESGGAV